MATLTIIVENVPDEVLDNNSCYIEEKMDAMFGSKTEPIPMATFKFRHDILPEETFQSLLLTASTAKAVEQVIHPELQDDGEE